MQSRYRARWCGTVLAEEWVHSYYGDYMVLHVRQEIDRRGNPIRNRKTVRYGVCFFRRVDRPVERIDRPAKLPHDRPPDTMTA